MSQAQKSLICNCLEDGLIEGDLSAPTSEEQLRDLQRVLNACDTIKLYEQKSGAGEVGWLNEDGKQFPVAIRKYFHHAASQFHSPFKVLPDKFSNKLRDFVRAERPNIATLNYDDLLYECFTGTDVFSQHMLRDGFFGEFNIEAHNGYYDEDTEGWFLHLHGSPLFVTREGTPQKLQRVHLPQYMGTNSVHLVLTNAKAKPAVIANSKVLSSYWKKLSEILRSPAEITLVGYGGGDLHLNRLIKESDSIERVRVVCRNGEASDQCLFEYWNSTIDLGDPGKLDVVRVDSVLDFDNWRPE